MHAFRIRIWRKPLLFCLLLAASLSLLFGIVMKQLPGDTPVVLAAGEEVRFFNEENVALANRNIRLLCFQGLLDTSPDDIRFVTTADGTMPVPLPAGCTHLAALHLWHTQPSGKPEHGPAYWVYTTSWQPGSSDLVMLAADGKTSVIIPDSNTLVLFNVVIGLAWKPPENSHYVRNLLEGLGENSVVYGTESASSYLYDLTQGTMAYGPITVHVNGEAWESTDIRIVPANDLKPSAQVGGIVAQSYNFTSTVFVTSTTVYSPGAITLGRNWVACAPATGSSPPSYLITCSPSDGVTETIKLYGATDAVAFGSALIKYGNWDDAPGYRTIVYEWAHYALFLYDEYQTVQAQPAHCTSTGNKLVATDSSNASAMDWHYTASEFWEELPPPGNCGTTKQYQFHGLSDCETLAAWYTIQQLPNASTLPPLGCAGRVADSGPNSLGLVKFLFNRMPPEVSVPLPFPHSIFIPGLRVAPVEPFVPRVRQTATSQTTLDARVQVNASLARATSYPPPTFVQAYQLRPDEAGSYDRIWYQGKVISDSSSADLWMGHVTVLGAQEKVDHVKVFGESYRTNLLPNGGRRWFGEATINSSTVVALQPDDWNASLDLAYEVDSHGQVVTVTAHVSLPVISLVSPDQVKAGIQICSPDYDVRCFWSEPLTFVSATPTQEYWLASISPTSGEPTLPNYGIVRLHVAYDRGNAVTENHELISWYKTSGVGPGSYNALAPTPPNEDDIVTLFSETVRRHCNQLVYSAASIADMLDRSLGKDGNGKNFVGLLGQPVDIAVRLPLEADGDECPQHFGRGSRTIAQQDIYLTLSYNQLIGVRVQETTLDRLTPAMENSLQILFFDPITGWEVVEPVASTRNTDMNWVSVPFTKDGIYAIGWTGP